MTILLGQTSALVGIGTATVSAALHGVKATEQLRVGYDADNYFSVTVGSTGAVTLNAVGAGAAFVFSDDIYRRADNGKVFWGAGDDMAVYYDGTNANIDTDVVAASDLVIDCGTAKTLVLEVPVWNDANVGGMALRAGATTPPVTQWLDNLGASTGIYSLGMAALDEVNGAIEIPHDYKKGSDLYFHVHWGSNAAPSDTDYVKWTLTYSVTRGGATFPPATPIHKETAHDTQYEVMLSDFDAISGTNFKIGDQFNFNLKRVVADGAAYAGVAILMTVGLHYQTDTLGSRQIEAK